LVCSAGGRRRIIKPPPEIYKISHKNNRK